MVQLLDMRIMIGVDKKYDMKLYRDYFSDCPAYPDKFFRRSFRMRRTLYLRIAQTVKEHDTYFVQIRNVAGAFELSCLQKVTTAYRRYHL
jgi:hypothetical protein